jgi:predicted RNA-binding protein with RPS1 domain
VEQDERWKLSVAAYNAARIEENRQAWREHHERQAAGLRAVLEQLIARHEEQAEKYRDQKIGEA